MSKKLGAIYTPEGHARILTSWAIRSRTDVVLDMGIGPGIFVYQSYERLLSIGAEKDQAVNQIYGAEIDNEVFKNFTQDALEQGLIFKNLQNANFFDINLPQLDAIVGNPPYVRRRGMSQESLKLIRERTILNNKNLDETDLSSLSDLYIYFLLYALPLLRPGGRLATIIADSWLNTRYGFVLKKYLLKEFEIEQIVSLDRSVFENAQVKAVILLASKKMDLSKERYVINFSRVRNGLSIDKLSSFVVNKENKSSKDIVLREVLSDTLSAESAWGAIFKSTNLFDDICSNDNIKPMQEVADIEIGLETLAKDFFVISKQDKERGIIEEKYLKPFAYSVYDFGTSVINLTDTPNYYLFYCSDSKEELKNTEALKYIARGEQIEVDIRGTDRTTIGYHNKERIQKARRPNWYDLKTHWDKKSIAEILLPRFIYKDYQVLWNVAKYVPGGAVVQFFPKNNLFNHSTDTKVYLAILESAFTEIALRINAQMYGGGTSNLRVSAIKLSPTIDVALLSNNQKNELINSYNLFLKDNDKSEINQTVYKILGLTKSQIVEMECLLLELRNIAESARKAAHPTAKEVRETSNTKM